MVRKLKPVDVRGMPMELGHSSNPRAKERPAVRSLAVVLSVAAVVMLAVLLQRHLYLHTGPRPAGAWGTWIWLFFQFIWAPYFLGKFLYTLSQKVGHHFGEACAAGALSVLVMFVLFEIYMRSIPLHPASIVVGTLAGAVFGLLISGRWLMESYWLSSR